MTTSAVFLQARMDSTRLPGKALKTLQGKAIVEHAMASLKRIPADIHVLLTARGDESYFRDLTEKMDFHLFAGSRDDVLDRFIQAGRVFEVDNVIRATGDNPLVAFEPASFLLEQLKNHPEWDYTAMRGLPLGCGVEVFRFSALEKACSLTEEPYDHEHVTPYIYNNPDQFNLEYYEAPSCFTHQGPVTIDTKEDFESISGIFDCLYKSAPIGIDELVAHLKKNDQTR